MSNSTDVNWGNFVKRWDFILFSAVLGITALVGVWMAGTVWQNNRVISTLTAQMEQTEIQLRELKDGVYTRKEAVALTETLNRLNDAQDRYAASLERRIERLESQRVRGGGSLR